ncbi:inner centromere protein [Syncephalis plumigaleata]|nr:inner centromere protein [Syncephalis plumigaleata]
MPNRMKQAAASAASSTHRSVTTSVNETNHEVTTIAVISKKSNGEIVYDLPEIESDYTDDDRTPKRPNNIANTVPHWAQPANLTQQLLQQQRVDPDRIFGRIEPIRMEAIFKGREDKYRHHQLTEEEEQAYRERMGYL